MVKQDVLSLFLLIPHDSFTDRFYTTSMQDKNYFAMRNFFLLLA